MPAFELSASRRQDARAGYYYRRKLGLRELLPAFGVAVAAGMLAFYVTRLMLQRTPLSVERGGRLPPAREVVTRASRGQRGRQGHPAA